MALWRISFLCQGEPDPNKNANQHKRREHGRPDRRPPLAQEADTAAFVSLVSSLFLYCC